MRLKSGVKTLRDWIDGKATTEQAKEARCQLRKAYYAVYDAYADAKATAAAYTAASAAYAYGAVYGAVYVAYTPVYAAAAAVATREQIKAKCCEIIRRHFPDPPKISKRNP